MAKYLVQFRYTPEGIKGLLKEGGTKRRAAVKKALESVGGQMECFHFTLGKYDGFGVAELPDAAAVAAFSMQVAATGKVAIHTTVIVEPEEIDAAARKKLAYRAPGR